MHQPASFFSKLEIQIRRHARSGEETPRRRDPGTCGRGDGGRLVAAPRRAPPPEGTGSAAKGHSGRATASTTPPAGRPSSPTLYTHRESGIPHPPSRRSSRRGEGSTDPPAARWEEGGSHKSPCSAVAGERKTSTKCCAIDISFLILAYIF